MAINKTLLFLTSLMLFANSFIYAQNNPILDNFIISSNNGIVFLNWIIKSGGTCNGIQIYRSSNNSSFKEIGTIAGICGNLSTPTSYNFIDENPVKNTINYYRLELGGNGTSQTLSIEIIDIDSEGSQVRPNPVFDDSRIYFNNNSTKDMYYLNVFDVNGKFIDKLITKETFFEIYSGKYSNGNYFFNILSSDKIIISKGKFTVIH